MRCNFSSLSPVMQALLAGLFNWFCTLIGASLVFFVKTIHQKFMDMMMGLAACIMTAVAVWPLLVPSLDYSQSIATNRFYWLTTAVGSIVGGLFIRFINYLVPDLHLNHQMSDKEGILNPKRPLSKTMLLYLAVVFHNIPEGLAVGVALPLRVEGRSRKSAFYYGAMSAIVESIAAVLGAYAVMSMTQLLPYALLFAAGAMIYVAVEELVPGAQEHKNTDIATSGVMAGFLIMMLLDTTLV